MNSEKTNLLVKNIIIMVFGLLFCVLKGRAISVMETIISSVMIVYGGFCLLIYLFSMSMISRPAFAGEGVVLFVTGLLLEFFPSFFVFAIALLILFAGLREILLAVSKKKIGAGKWIFELIIGIVFAAFGGFLLIMYNTSIASNIISVILGVLLILYGAICIFMELPFKKTIKHEDKNPYDDSDFKDYKIN